MNYFKILGNKPGPIKEIYEVIIGIGTREEVFQMPILWTQDFGKGIREYMASDGGTSASDSGEMFIVRCYCDGLNCGQEFI